MNYGQTYVPESFESIAIGLIMNSHGGLALIVKKFLDEWRHQERNGNKKLKSLNHYLKIIKEFGM